MCLCATGSDDDDAAVVPSAHHGDGGGGDGDYSKLPLVLQGRVDRGWAAFAPPAGATPASVSELAVGDTLWVEFEGDEGLWYKAKIVLHGGSNKAVRFDDGTWWRSLDYLEDDEQQWRREPAAAVAASSGAAAAASSSSNDASGSAEPLDRRLQKIGWHPKHLEDGSLVYEGRLRPHLLTLFTATSIEKAVAMHTSASTLGDTDIKEYYRNDAATHGKGSKRACQQPPPLELAEEKPTSKPTAVQRAGATFTFGDFCHGIGGMRVVCSRLGGLLVAACDEDQSIRASYREHLRELGVELDAAFHLPRMEDMAHKCMYDIDLICAGPPCQPFSNANTSKDGLGQSSSVWNRAGGDALGELFESLRTRIEVHKVKTHALLIENVVGMLQYLTEERLAPLRKLGYHWKVLQADATIFGCATTRPRIAIVAFRDKEHLARFGNGPRPTHTTAGIPLSAVLNPEYNDPINTPTWLWLRPNGARGACSPMHQAQHASSQVVGINTTEVINVRTKSNDSYTPQGNGGTYVCVHPSVASQPHRLGTAQLANFAGWYANNPERTPVFRRLHLTEELRAFTWRLAEIPSEFKGALGKSLPKDRYAAISESLCPNPFEAIAARMLWAMGKQLPEGTVIEEALPELKHFKTKSHPESGLEYIKLLGLQQEPSGGGEPAAAAAGASADAAGDGAEGDADTDVEE